jgi:hypothetical protein
MIDIFHEIDLTLKKLKFLHRAKCGFGNSFEGDEALRDLMDRFVDGRK